MAAAEPRINLRKLLRRIAREAQARNVARLVAGVEVAGGRVEPLASTSTASKTGRRAVRTMIAGERRSLDVSRTPGVRTGAMLKAIGKASALRIRKDGFKIVPDRSVMRKWFAFTAGRRSQSARSVSGVLPADVNAAARLVAAEVRDQIIAFHKKRGAESSTGQATE